MDFFFQNEPKDHLNPDVFALFQLKFPMQYFKLNYFRITLH
jgi:hypothetical protein